MTKNTDKKDISQQNNQLDMFEGDKFKVTSLRDDVLSMELPFFALRAGDKNIRTYDDGNKKVVVSPNAAYGMATIHDKDLWIYFMSKIQQAKFEGKPTSKTVIFTPYDFFKVTGRNSGGKNYTRFKSSLNRLKGTMISTNAINDDGSFVELGYGLIESWGVVKNSAENDGLFFVTLPDWLYESIEKNKILKITEEYFKIRKGLTRRLYEIARKHCGHQYRFEIGLDKLKEKSGSRSSIRRFKWEIKELVGIDSMPEYKISMDEERSIVIFENRDTNNPKVIESKKKQTGKRESRKIVKMLEQKKN